MTATAGFSTASSKWLNVVIWPPISTCCAAYTSRGPQSQRAKFFARPAQRVGPAPKYSRQTALDGIGDSLITLTQFTDKTAPHVIHIVSSPVHNAQDSPEIVSRAISVAGPPPDTLILELCALRARHIGSETMIADERTSKVVRSRTHALWDVGFLDNLFGTITGLETLQAPDMEAAVAAAKGIGLSQSQILLGDRRIDKTIESWTKQARWQERALLMLDALVAKMFRPTFKLRKENMDIRAIRIMIQRWAPAMYKALYAEREMQMIWSVRDSPAARSSRNVMLICGRIHANAIATCLQTGTEATTY